jgi:serine/threonine protein phosphatase PrpC
MHTGLVLGLGLGLYVVHVTADSEIQTQSQSSSSFVGWLYFALQVVNTLVVILFFVEKRRTILGVMGQLVSSTSSPIPSLDNDRKQTEVQFAQEQHEHNARMVVELEAKIDSLHRDAQASLRRKEEVVSELEQVISNLKDKVRKEEREHHLLKERLEEHDKVKLAQSESLLKAEKERDLLQLRLDSAIEENRRLVKLIEEMKDRGSDLAIKVRQLEEEREAMKAQLAVLQECVSFVEKCKSDLEIAVRKNNLLEQELENAKQEFVALQRQLMLVQRQYRGENEKEKEGTAAHREPTPLDQHTPIQLPDTRNNVDPSDRTISLIPGQDTQIGTDDTNTNVDMNSDLQLQSQLQDDESLPAIVPFLDHGHKVNLLASLESPSPVKDIVTLSTSLSQPQRHKLSFSAKKIQDLTHITNQVQANPDANGNANDKDSSLDKDLQLSGLGMDFFKPPSDDCGSGDIASTEFKFNLDGIDASFLTTENELVIPSKCDTDLGSPSDQDFFHQPESSTQTPFSTKEDAPIRKKVSSSQSHKSVFSLFQKEDDIYQTEEQKEAILPPTSSQSLSPTSVSPGGVLVVGYGVKADINKQGLRRAKKGPFAFGAKGKHAQPQMEDVNICLYPFRGDTTRALFGVFDGHAGKEAAEDAVALFPKEFAKQLDNGDGHNSDVDLTPVFHATFVSVDQAMLQHEYVGATATVLYLWQVNEDRYLQAANVGDSTAFLCRDGVAIQLTVDHKPSEPSERQRMREAGLEVSDNQTRINGLAVSRTLGDHFVKQQNIGMIGLPHVSKSIRIAPNDSFVIIASDGLWDVLSGQRAVDIIKGEQDPQMTANMLLQTALLSPKCNDNVTVVVVRLN